MEAFTFYFTLFSILISLPSACSETENVTAFISPASGALEIIINEAPTTSAHNLTSNLNSVSRAGSKPSQSVALSSTAKPMVIINRKYRPDETNQRKSKQSINCDCSYMTSEGNERAIVAMLGLLSLLCIATIIAGVVLLIFPRLLHKSLQKFRSLKEPSAFDGGACDYWSNKRETT
ncbi:uncharacterized protein LOC119955955 isoform X3 [Scyliorhinus canicula]|uniref:uncharacterized protein LOC119955955 isoform X3 n=1 Tax=Scyliorhinus canicula TaxID=7830 RepID=UPI0018F2DE75|nr:uncharacterized protein LOC119955955 isoform X3 [Scyliorhinus canicula]